MRSIAIILPGISFFPIGGYKVMYEYAKRLARLGYEITIYYPEKLAYIKRGFVRILVKFLLSHITSYWRWYDFEEMNKQIKHVQLYQLEKEKIEKHDLIFVTSVETAYEVKGLELSKPVLYFIQHFENWNLDETYVIRSYHFGFYNIVISKWLKEKLESVNAKVFLLLPNGIDTNVFKIIIKPEFRDDKTVMMLYHKVKWKGSLEGIEALKILKDEFPDLKVTLFSVFKRPASLPKWINFVRNPKLNELVRLYNEHAIFLSPSYYEGFSLPPAEAMACGCALVSTNSGGVIEYAQNGKNAEILSSPPNPEEIANAIKKIILERERRIRLAYEGNKTIQQNFSWDRSVDMLDKFIKTLTK